MPPEIIGAGDETRTRDFHLGKVALYQLSYSRSQTMQTDTALPNFIMLWSGKRDSNPRPSAWEADALPAELFPRMVGGRGLEPLTSSA